MDVNGQPIQVLGSKIVMMERWLAFAETELKLVKETSRQHPCWSQEEIHNDV